MKPIFIHFCILSISLVPSISALGQGTFIFSNRYLSHGVNEPVTILDPITGECIRPEGDGWHVQLLIGQEGTPVDQLQPLEPVLDFRTGADAGYVFGEFVARNVLPNELASVLVRVYGGSDWATSPSRAEAGPFSVLLSTPLGPPPPVILPEGALTFCIIPEPSIATLSLLGVLAIFSGHRVRRGRWVLCQFGQGDRRGPHGQNPRARGFWESEPKN